MQDEDSGLIACGSGQPQEEDGYGYSGLYGYSPAGHYGGGCTCH